MPATSSPPVTEPDISSARRGGWGSVVRSIRARIVAAFIMSLVAMSGALLFLITQQSAISQSLALTSQTYLPMSQVAARLEDTRQRVERDVQRLRDGEPRPTTGTTFTEEAFQSNLRQGHSLIERAQAMELAAEDMAALNQLATYLDRIDAAARAYQNSSGAFVHLAESSSLERAESVAAKLYADSQILSEETRKFTGALDEHTSALSTKTEQAQARAVAIAVSVASLASLFALALIGAVLYALAPLGRLTEQAQRLAAGDYSHRMDVSGHDEIAVLSGEFDKMAKAVQDRDRALVERAEELDRLSAYLTSVLNSMVEGLVVVVGQRVTLANPAAERVWGVRRGSPPPSPLASLDRAGRHELRDGAGRLQEVRVVPFADQGVLVVSADITDATETRERLARSERLALVGQMLAQITHEVRNPLNALSLNAELMVEELTDLDPAHDGDVWQTLELMSREIERLTAVTGHYLQLARRPPAQLAAERLHNIVSEVSLLLAPELEQAGVTLTREAPDIGPVLADGNQIRQALINVVRNAVEAGATTLRLVLSVQDGSVRLAMHDDGPGMSVEQRDKALDPFYSTKATGTGLGLAITRQILEDHGGTVDIGSSPLGGATVTLVLAHRVPEAHEEIDAADRPGRR